MTLFRSQLRQAKPALTGVVELLDRALDA